MFMQPPKINNINEQTTTTTTATMTIKNKQNFCWIFTQLLNQITFEMNLFRLSLSIEMTINNFFRGQHWSTFLNGKIGYIKICQAELEIQFTFSRDNFSFALNHIFVFFFDKWKLIKTKNYKSKFFRNTIEGALFCLWHIERWAISRNSLKLNQ